MLIFNTRALTKFHGTLDAFYHVLTFYVRLFVALPWYLFITNPILTIFIYKHDYVSIFNLRCYMLDFICAFRALFCICICWRVCYAFCFNFAHFNVRVASLQRPPVICYCQFTHIAKLIAIVIILIVIIYNHSIMTGINHVVDADVFITKRHNLQL